MQEFRLPDPGEGLVEADIVTWRVAVGDEVAVNDVVVEVETSKSLVELPIPFAGRVHKLLVSEGDLVDVGAPIILIDDGSGPAESGSEEEQAQPEGVEPENGGPAKEPERVPNLVGYGPRAGGTKRRARKPAIGDEAGDSAVGQTREQVAQVFDQSVPVSRRYDEQSATPRVEDVPRGAPLPSPHQASDPVPTPVAGVLAKPPVRKLAKDLGIDLGSIAGSGEGGIVTRDDVIAADEASRAVAAAPPTSGAGALRQGGLEDKRIPIRGVRKATAQAMVDSAFSAPHVTEWMDVDVTATMEFVETLKTHPDFAGVRVSPTLWVARAACLAIAKHPELNSSWDGPAQEIVQHGQLNLGIAAATPRGLLVPNIKNAGALSLAELAGAMNELVEVAKQGRTQPAATSGGTFTITNVGVFGVDAGTPIINPGEAAILCVGAIRRKPWVVGTGASERVEPRWITTLAVAFDHRMIDGAAGSLFLAEVARMLNQPALAVL